MSRASLILDRVLSDVDKTKPFISEHGLDSWTQLKRLVGRDKALEYVGLPRDEIMQRLRVEHGHTLQSIADIFGLSRERVRQLTPAGLWHSSSALVDWDAITVRVIRLAVANKTAWTSKGRIRRGWVAERFGKDVAAHMPDAHLGMNKLEMILRFRLNLADRAACLRWLNEQYFKQERGYAEIAKRLSVYIPISTMCVHRNAAEIGFQGYPVGRRPDLDFG